MIKWIFTFLILVVGCSDYDILNTEEEQEPQHYELTLYMNRTQDEDGNYLVTYSGYPYTEVYYTTEHPNMRVYWGSVDSFYVSYQNQIR